VAEAPVFPQELNGNGRCEALAVMIGSMGKYKTQYAEFVNSLADYIIALTASFQLPELDSIPDEVSNVFDDCEEPEMKSQTNNPPPDRKVKNLNQNVNQNLLIIDGAFVKSVADQMKKTEESLTPVSMGDPFAPPQPTDEPYSICIVDEDKEFLDLIKATCHYSPQLPRLNCETYQDPVALLNEVRSAWQQEQSAPDLLLIDLELREKNMQGVELIEELALKTKIPSAILALSNNLNDATLNGAFRSGAGMVVSKLLTPDELLPRMRRFAKIGRNRWLWWTDRISADETRKKRPVFLSYSRKNEDTARIITNFLECSDIDVFYADDSIRPGDDQAARVRAALSARVFIALISDTYESSGYCIGELDNALEVQKDNTKNPGLKIIPILYNSPKTAEQNSPILKCIEKNRELTMEANRPLDALQKLLLSVKYHLRPLTRSAKTST